ncbi:MAG TPA: hypothetical protein VFP65_06140 [Anaeromyxobacteraceae bacterium]|nr:hypothetical protein [Anaeromyxobacteraceae bacterium]
MRWFLVAMLLHGLVPGLAEAGEALVHYVHTGHVAHTSADRGDLGDQGPEHGCGTTQHRCACCATQLVEPAREIVVATVLMPTTNAVPPAKIELAPREPARPFRPPIS